MRSDFVHYCYNCARRYGWPWGGIHNPVFCGACHVCKDDLFQDICSTVVELPDRTADVEPVKEELSNGR